MVKVVEIGQKKKVSGNDGRLHDVLDVKIKDQNGDMLTCNLWDQHIGIVQDKAV